MLLFLINFGLAPLLRLSANCSSPAKVSGFLVCQGRETYMGYGYGATLVSLYIPGLGLGGGGGIFLFDLKAAIRQMISN